MRDPERDSLKDSERLVAGSPKFRRWRDKLKENGVTLHGYRVLAAISRDGQNLFSALLDCDLETSDSRVTRCMFIRGESVSVIPAVRCSDDGDWYALMVEQHRFGAGGTLTQEFPSGMVEGDDPRASAVKELREELGLVVRPEELQPLTREPLVLCTSMVDETVHFFYLILDRPRAFLDGLEGRSAGLAAEHEYIRIRVQRMRDVAGNLNFLCPTGVKLLERALGRMFL